MASISALEKSPDRDSSSAPTLELATSAKENLGLCGFAGLASGSAILGSSRWSDQSPSLETWEEIQLLICCCATALRSTNLIPASFPEAFLQTICPAASIPSGCPGRWIRILSNSSSYPPPSRVTADVKASPFSLMHVAIPPFELPRST